MGDLSLVAVYKRTIALSHLYLLWVGVGTIVNIKPCPCYFLPTQRECKSVIYHVPLLTLFITRVRSPLSSSSGVGGRGLFGAPLDEGPVREQSDTKFTQPNKTHMTYDIMCKELITYNFLNFVVYHITTTTKLRCDL